MKPSVDFGEPFSSDPFGSELRAEGLRAEPRVELLEVVLKPLLVAAGYSEARGN
jgi:hypothetical protein